MERIGQLERVPVELNSTTRLRPAGTGLRASLARSIQLESALIVGIYEDDNDGNRQRILDDF